MNRLAVLALGLGFASQYAHAQSIQPSVDVFGVNKNAYYRQTDTTSAKYEMSGIYAFVEGNGISATFPAQPVTITEPSGTQYTLHSSEDSLRFDTFETSFKSAAALNTLFPDGTYTFASGGHNYQLNLAGSYAAAPLVQFSAGRWQGDQLVLTAAQAAADWEITSSTTNTNGFRSIAINDASYSFDYFTHEQGPGTISARIAGGSLKPGMTYNVEVEFDNIVDQTNPTAGDLRDGYALYSTTTLLTVSVLPELELFWHHQDGTNYLLGVDGHQFNNERELNQIPSGWFVVGQGDLNADGETDIVWRNSSTGEVYLYLMQQGSIKQQASLANISDLTWQIATIADVNADHKTDLIWHNQQTGETVVWLMDGLHYTNELALPQVSDLNWQLDGSGDFDGDGSADLYWHNHKTGENYLFMMKNGQVQTELELFSVADTAWQMAALGDFNADGKTDMYWRNNQTGENYVILMDGRQVIGERDAIKVADLNWQIVASADFDGDKQADLLWRNKTTGENHLFLLDGLNLKADYPLPQVKDLNWQVGAVLNRH